MQTVILKWLRGLFLAAMLVVVASAAAHALTYEYYYYNNWNDYLLKRVRLDNGEIYEYLQEDLYGHYGRISLIYKPSLGGYSTYDWGTTQVTVKEYVGEYSPPSQSDPRSDVVTAEQRILYIYDHNSVMNNLDTQTNGWIMRRKDILQDDGSTLREAYVYNASNVMTRHSIYDTGGNLTEEYLYDDTGRLTRDDHVADNRYYKYTYHPAPNQDLIHYKEEYNRSTDVLLSTYEYISSAFYARRDPDGTMYTYDLVAPVSYTNSHLAPDGTFAMYRYDSSWNFQGATKYLPSGAVEKLNSSWKLTEKIEPVGTFLKGVNLPWVRHGYDIGAAPGTGDHVGLSKNLSDLYNLMDKRKGDYVRFFLFCDFRAGMNFDQNGKPTGFTDKVYEDMQALIDAAKVLGVKLMPVLFNYKIADGFSGSGEAEHAQIISTYRQELLDIFAPFFERFAGDDTIYAWDIMNEPEMASASNISDLRGFVGAFTNLIHSKASSAKVTVGALNRGGLSNWTGLGLDLYQFHYYDRWEGTYPLNYAASALGLDKPVIAGELEPTDVVNKINILRQNGYLGGLFWEDGTDNPNPDYVISDADYALIKDWYYGTRYTFYLSSMIESKTLVAPDGGGNIYYHYIDENFNSQGYGRIDRARRQVPLNGDLSYEYIFYAGTNRYSQAKGYSDAAWTNLAATYTYYNDSTNRLESKTLSSADGSGNIYYHYVNENFNSLGYGRVDKQGRVVADSDGAKGYEYEYFTDTNTVSSKKAYQNADYTNPSSPALTNLLMTYTYYSNGRLERKILQAADANGNVQYRYRNEAFYNVGTSSEYGRLSHIYKSNGTKLYYTTYWTGTENPKTVEEYDSNWQLVTTYTYYLSGLLESKTLATADAGNNIYFHYLDENFNSRGYGRMDVLKKTVADGDGALAYRYSYSTAEPGRVIKKECYSDSNLSTLAVAYNYYDDNSNRMRSKTLASGISYTYYNNAANRMESKTLSSADGDGNVYYRYIDENFTSGYGRVDKQVRSSADSDGAKGYEYAYFTATNTVSSKKAYQNANYTNPSNPALTNLLMTYTYYSNGRLERKILTTADSGGNVQYRYHNEAFYNVGGSNEYGRLSHLYKTTGNKLYYAAYWTGTATPKTVEEYNSSWQLVNTYTYYSNGRMERKFPATPDADGNVQYRYHNEAFYNVGSPNEQGRLSHLYKSNGTKLYYAAYYAGTDKPKTVEEYNASWVRTNTYTYTYYSNGRLERKILTTADSGGNVQYRYHNEAFYNVGGSNEYGRLSHLYKTTGNKLYYAAYWTGTATPKTVEEYNSSWQLVNTYTYYSNGRMERKFPATPDADGNVQYRYHNEAFYNVGSPNEQGRLSHLYKSNGTKLYYAAYYAGTDKPKTVEEYNASWVRTNTYTYTYYSNGRLERKFLSTPDADGNVQYRYHNEAFYNVGSPNEQGRLSHLYKTNGTKLYYAAYWTGTATPKTVEEYNSSWQLVNTCTYYSNGRLESKTLASPDTDGNIYYHYKNENWGESGLGRTDIIKRLSADSDGAKSFQFVYSDDADGRLIKKRCYANSDLTGLKAIYTRFNNGNNREESKTLIESGKQTTYVRYDDADNRVEAKVMAGPYAPNPTDNQYDVYYKYLADNSWRTSYQIRSSLYADGDGAYSHIYSYYATGEVHYKYAYSDQFWGDGFGSADNAKLLWTYVYQTDGASSKSSSYVAPDATDTNELAQRLTIQNKVKSYGTTSEGGFTFTSAMAGEGPNPFNQ